MTAYDIINPCPDGLSLGEAAADKIALHGAVPCVQAAHVAALGTTAATSETPYGFASAAQANAIATAVNAIQVALENKGIVATS